MFAFGRFFLPSLLSLLSLVLPVSHFIATELNRAFAGDARCGAMLAQLVSRMRCQHVVDKAGTFKFFLSDLSLSLDVRSKKPFPSLKIPVRLTDADLQGAFLPPFTGPTPNVSPRPVSRLLRPQILQLGVFWLGLSRDVSRDSPFGFSPFEDASCLRVCLLLRRLDLSMEANLYFTH